jgi:hypothetical protein
MKVAHFYHAYLESDAWPEIVSEHIEALASFTGPITVGLMGARSERDRVVEMFAAAELDASFVVLTGQWEHDTLELVRRYVASNDGAVLYGHTKGASQPTEFNDRWRRSMQHYVVEGWKGCRDSLMLGNHDAVGCHWLHPDVFGETVMGAVPFFGGNYWMATCDYLRALPPVPTEDRFGAERWIGLGNPKVLDLAPGWPGDGSFAQEATV